MTPAVAEAAIRDFRDTFDTVRREIAKVVVGAGSVVCTAFLGWVVTTYAGALVSAIASAAPAKSAQPSAKVMTRGRSGRLPPPARR